MKKLLLTICFLLLTTSGYSAELLVQAKGHWMDELPKVAVDKMTTQDRQGYEARSQVGDIIAVRPDGWKWGKEERLPNYIVVRVPDLSVKDAKKYEENITEFIPDAQAEHGQRRKLIRKRKYSFSKQEVEIAKNGSLSAIQISKAVFDTKKTEKTGDTSEVIQPKTDLLSYLKYIVEPYTRNYGKAYAATQLKKVVAPSGGDYTALETCMNANEQNLVTADKYFDVEISGDWSGGDDTTAVTVHNYTTDATRYINIYTTGSAAHNGTAQDVSSGTNYVISGMNGTNCITINTNYTTLNGVEVTGWTGNASGVYFTGDYDVLKNLIIHDTSSSWSGISGDTTVTYGKIINCIIYDIDDNGIWGSSEQWGADDFRVLNCTIYNNSGDGLAGGANYPRADNTISYNNGNSDFGSATAGEGNYSFSKDDSAKGAQSIHGDTDGKTPDFVSTTAGSEDLHLQSTSDAIDVAADFSAQGYTVDIDGDTFGDDGNWDMGADEYTAAATGRTRRFF